MDEGWKGREVGSTEKGCREVEREEWVSAGSLTLFPLTRPGGSYREAKVIPKQLSPGGWEKGKR